MRSVRYLATLATLAFSTTAAAQLQSADERLAGRLDASTREQVVALVDSLKSEGLPTEPLVDRALEGASKRADGSRIVSVVRGFATHLRVARTVLGPSNDRELIAGANALKAGIKKEELARVRASRDGVRYAVAFDVLTGLKNRNVPSDTAVRVVGALVKLAANDHQYVALLDQIERAIAAGTPPALAASEQGITVERAVIAEGGNSGTPGGQLPSPRGVLQPGPSATNPNPGTVTRIQPEGQGAPAPRGKSQKPRKP
ncbi:MAG: hypothetical protein ACT4P6_00660 [Gemmatimonadaceae bacterium]